ncbi:hypothetical protein [Paramicrobacterium agarici]|uniref:Uncharacterized protein n=1 Tax=Paramicrobacterium agarici TaxID=630514 RepID=A0A2A9E1V0_9MICO|nr:hypothetical protein [Microbacterium agarici]PFG32169.1 hypothetical protein ATJ78_3156 [Microbacterium agarici]
MTDPDEGRSTSRWWFVVATVVIAALVVASGALVASLVSTASPEADPPPATEAPDPERPLPENQPAPEHAGPNPTSCEQIYSEEMYSYLTGTGMPLNDQSVAENVGSYDPELIAVINGIEHLDCSWGFAGDYGLTTSVTRVNADAVKTVRERMTELGYNCHDEDGGTRCLTSATEAGNRYGESHFVRDGLWLATAWVNFAPEGYTPDIVQTLWPDTAPQP